jgi:hypothetical protein
VDVDVWVDVVGYEGLYEVSRDGYVRRAMKSRGARVGHVLKPRRTPNGYHLVYLYRDGRPRNELVHRIVLEAYVGPPAAGQEACHNDGDPDNNSVSNLRWDTHLSNMGDISTHGTHSSSRRDQCPYGHDLRPPNLVPALQRQGKRACLACVRARDIARRRGTPFDAAMADLKYDAIMNG